MTRWLLRLLHPDPPPVVQRATRVATDLESLGDRRRREAEATVRLERDRRAAGAGSGAFILDAMRAGSIRDVIAEPTGSGDL